MNTNCFWPAVLTSFSTATRRLAGRAAVALVACATVVAPSVASAANIVWVTDNSPAGFSALGGAVFAEDGWYTLLTNAGHKVIRFNPNDSQNTPPTAAEFAALNTNDLIILGRSIASGHFQAPAVGAWNSNVIKPLMSINVYLTRSVRAGWYSGETLPNGTPTVLSAYNLADPKTAYIFGGVAMNGTNTVNVYDEAGGQNTSQITQAPVAGGVRIAGSTPTAWQTISDWPAGTLVRGNNDRLGGYRMQFSAGLREASGGTVPQAGAENLTATGENIFLRAVMIAINNGNLPSPPDVPTNLTGVALNAQVQLNWSSAPLAAGYYVKRSLTPGGPYSNIFTQGLTTAYADFDVVNDTTYYYVVSAFNSVGESANSTELAIMPREAPVNLVAVGGTNEVTVSWDALAGAASYTLKRSSNPSGPFTTVASGILGTSHTDTPVAGGQIHYYVVVAQLTAGGDSGQSATVSAPTAPNASAIDAVLFAANVLRVGWAAGGQSSQYFLESSTDGVVFSPLATLAGNVLSYTNSGLLPDTSYFYRVQSTNISGFSPYSNIASNRTPAFGYNINIANSTNSSQNTNQAPVPPGYVVDEGELFGDRGNGLSYGWSTVGGTNITRDSRRRESPLSPDVRYDTLNQFMRNPVNNPAFSATWEIELTNGFYQVHVVGGDAGATDSTFQFNVEGVISPAVVASATARWYEYTTNVGVSDGRLTITSGPQALNNKFCFIDIYPAIPFAATFTQQPQSVTVEQSRPSSLSATAYGSPNLAYQWYQNDLAVNGATNPTLSFAHTPLAADGDYYLVVTNYAGSVTSAVVTLEVTPDTTSPFVVSVGSVDGVTIGVRFNEELNAVNAVEPSSYAINGGGGISPTNVTLLPDGRTVKLILNGTISGPFTLDVYDMIDLSDQYSGVSSGASVVMGLTSVGDVGAPAFAGSHLTVDGQVIEIVGGGADIWTGSDQFYFVSKTITGDFDMSVQVTSLSLPHNIAKAALLARESRDANSRTIHVSVNPPPPGRNSAEMAVRPTTGANTVLVAPASSPGGLPSNAWLRLKREGSIFTGYRSTNGVDWIQLGQTNQVYGLTMVVGLGVTSHTNSPSASLSATGLFQNFSITQNVADVAITKTGESGPFLPGRSVTNIITVTNHGPDTAFTTVVSDPIPAGFSFVSAIASPGSCSFAGGVVTCHLGLVPVGVEPIITIVMQAVNAGSWTNTATVASSTLESSTANNAASAVTQVASGFTSLGQMSFSGGVFSGSFATEVGLSYQIQFRTNLPPQCSPGAPSCPPDTESWQTLTNIAGDGTLKTFTDPAPDPNRRFYRILVDD